MNINQPVPAVRQIKYKLIQLSFKKNRRGGGADQA
jgi:hypothetical protein